MFPALRHRLLSRIDLLVELSTLGEYGVDERGAPMPLGCEPRLAPRVRDRCGPSGARRTQPACATEPARAARARP
jgi:hypothetical protein